ncbi:receptor-type tyrosine-protein phosphatase F-like isoform X2 [Oscarella lobularis]|uniref:receptor-type tyrosine-protein phosphatase F-like isoform X2 n=1 Tax=Oscarella lobularis TaxID=121494 RepID=UPI0033142808
MVKRTGLIIEGRTILCVVLVFTSLLWSTTETTTTTPEIETPTTLVERVPSQPPANLTVTSLDPFLHRNSCINCIRVEWDPPPLEDRNGNISLYEIHYVGEEFDTNPHTVNVSGYVQSFHTILTGLEEFVVYDVKIRAYNPIHPSPYSSIQSVRTYAVPPARPTDLSFLNVTSISGVDGLVDLKVTWSLSPRNVNGLFAGFRVRYQCSSDNSSMNEEVHGQTTCCHDCRSFVCALAVNITEHVITNLPSYSWYNVYVYALSKDDSLGFLYVSGWTSSVVLTAESKPTGAPRNMSVVDIVGGKELLVEWSEVSCTEINGLLREYVIYYQRESESTLLHVTASPHSTNFTISNLEPLNEYSVRMRAVTGAGEGPLTSVVKARTAQRGSSSSVTKSEVGRCDSNCAFPFTYQKFKYTDCTKVGLQYRNFRPWCMTNGSQALWTSCNCDFAIVQDLGTCELYTSSIRLLQNQLKQELICGTS